MQTLDQEIVKQRERSISRFTGENKTGCHVDLCFVVIPTAARDPYSQKQF